MSAIYSLGVAVYLFRAYEQNEYDPFLCFCIAQAFFGRAMNRQVDNRNYQITQVRLAGTAQKEREEGLT